MQKLGEKFYWVLFFNGLWNVTLLAAPPAGWKQITPNLIRSDDGTVIMGSNPQGFHNLALTAAGELVSNGYVAPDIYRLQYAAFLCEHPDILLGRDLRILFVTYELDAKRLPADKAEACYRAMLVGLRKHENESQRDRVLGSAVARKPESYLDRLQLDLWGTGEKSPATKAATIPPTHAAKGYEPRTVADKVETITVPETARAMMEDLENELKKAAEPQHSLDVPAFLNKVGRLEQAKVPFREIEKKIVSLKLAPELRMSALTASDAVFRTYTDLNVLRTAKPEYANEWERRTGDLSQLAPAMFSTPQFMLWLQSTEETSPSLLEAIPKLFCPLGKEYVKQELRKPISDYLDSHPGNEFAITLSRAARFYSSSPQEISPTEMGDYKKYWGVANRDCPAITANWLQSNDFPRYVSLRQDHNGSPVINLKEGPGLDAARDHVRQVFGADRIDKLIAHNQNEIFRPIGSAVAKKGISYGKFLETVVKPHHTAIIASVTSGPIRLSRDPRDLKPKVSSSDKAFSKLAQDRAKFDIRPTRVDQGAVIPLSECPMDQTLFLADPIDSVRMDVPENGQWVTQDNNAMKLGVDKIVASGGKLGVNVFRPNTPERFVEVIAEFSKKFPDRRIPCVSFLGHGCPIGATMCTNKPSLAFNGLNSSTRGLIRRINESGAEIDKLRFLSCLVADGAENPEKENVMLALAGGLHGQPEITAYSNIISIPGATNQEFTMSGYAEGFAVRPTGKMLRVKLKDAELTEKTQAAPGKWIGLAPAEASK